MSILITLETNNNRISSRMTPSNEEKQWPLVAAVSVGGMETAWITLYTLVLAGVLNKIEEIK